MTETNQPAERTIILHYHLFKNAGTSVDAILKHNFGNKWVTREFPDMCVRNTALVEEWIRETPDAVAYSSHTMMGPIPQVEGVRVISFMLLRDPIERIKSAYRFERTQQADTLGTQLAKEHDFEGYVRARLARSGDRQCRNFQTYRLSTLVSRGRSEYDRAKMALEELSVVGRVEEFANSMDRLAACLPSRMNFTFDIIKANVSAAGEEDAINPCLLRILHDSNCDDTSLLHLITH